MANFFKCDICGREMCKIDPISIYKVRIRDLNAPDWEDESKEKHYLCYKCGAKIHQLIMDYKKEVTANGYNGSQKSCSRNVSERNLEKQGTEDAGQADLGDLQKELGEAYEAIKSLAGLFNITKEG